MKPHTRIYFKTFGYTPGEWVPCEIAVMDRPSCKSQRGECIDVHHIDARGMGGSKTKDSAANLMGLCRECHDYYGDKSHYMDWLQNLHRRFILRFYK